MDDDVRRMWDANAETWARHQEAGYDTYRTLYHGPAFFEFVGDLSGKLVLDAGCGAGTTTREMAARGMTVVGVDLSERMIEAARDHERRDPVGIRYEVGSVCDMPMFADASFDAVLSTMAIMDLADYEGAVREIWRVLRPGGMFAFIICHPCFTHEIRGWERDEQGSAIALTVGTYLDERTRVERWTFGLAPDRDEVEPFEVMYFCRTLQTYLNGLIGAGFRIAGVLEPAPDEATCEQDPRLRKWRNFPHALCVEAVKEPG